MSHPATPSHVQAPAHHERGLRPPFALLGAIAAAVAGGVLAPTAAHAAPELDPTPQAADYGAAWVPYVDPAALVADRALTCIIDTGVAVTPDTPADHPAGPIVQRTSINGLPAEPDASGHKIEHGTLMAAAAAAPRRGMPGAPPAFISPRA